MPVFHCRYFQLKHSVKRTIMICTGKRNYKISSLKTYIFWAVVLLLFWECTKNSIESIQSDLLSSKYLNSTLPKSLVEYDDLVHNKLGDHIGLLCNDKYFSKLTSKIKKNVRTSRTIFRIYLRYAVNRIIHQKDGALATCNFPSYNSQVRNVPIVLH